MAPKHMLPLLLLATSLSVVVAVVACSSSSDGGAASDAGLDAAGSDAGVGDTATAAGDADADAAEAAPCSDIPVADGDVYMMCVVASCCSELTQCKKDCADYKACVIACSQTDADPSCIDQCAMHHSNGQVQLHNLSNCENTMCTAPGDH